MGSYHKEGLFRKLSTESSNKYLIEKHKEFAQNKLAHFLRSDVSAMVQEMVDSEYLIGSRYLRPRTGAVGRDSLDRCFRQRHNRISYTGLFRDVHFYCRHVGRLSLAESRLVIL